MAAPDEVYGAVVRDMITPARGPAKARQPVFDDMALSQLAPGSNIQSCKESIRKEQPLQAIEPPPFNSFANKVYRAVSQGRIDGSLRADTIQDFLEKSCGIGRRSRTLHTRRSTEFRCSSNLTFRGSRR